MATWMTPPTHDTDQFTPWSEGPRLVRQNAFMVDPTQPYNPFDHIDSTHSDESSTSMFSPITSPFSSSVEDDNADHDDDDDNNNIENENQFYYHHTGQSRSLTPLSYQQQQAYVNDTDFSHVVIQNATLYRSRQRIPLAPVYERRSPLPENTGDYDEPLPISATSTSDHDPQTTISDNSSPTPPSAISTILLWPGVASIFGIIVYQICACTELKIMPSERLHTADPSAPDHVWVPVFYWSCWNSVWFARCRLAVAFGGIAMLGWYSWQYLKRRS